jgi:hypothetical protein
MKGEQPQSCQPGLRPEEISAEPIGKANGPLAALL